MTSDDRRYRDKLQQQLAFLNRSCASFDQGVEDEALRIATALRALFHQTPRSHSLIGLLGMRSSKMLSSTQGFSDFRDYLNINIDLRSPTPVRMLPRLQSQFREIDLVEWWESETVHVQDGVKYARRALVLSAANKDGGVHVDPDLEPYYEKLVFRCDIAPLVGNLTYDGPAPFEQGVPQHPPNVQFAFLRQFAHECMVASIHFRWLDESQS